jgi:outer membrane autotransporter protein
VDIVGGTLKAASTDTIMGVKQYTIIEADNITGTFDAVDTALIDTEILVSDDVSLENGVDSLVLQINAKRFDDPGIVQTENQKALAGALHQIDVAAGGDNPVTTALQSLESIEDVRNAYDQLSGQTSPQLMPVAAVDTSKFMGIISDRLNYAKLDIPYGPGSETLLAMAEPDRTNPYSSSYYTSPFYTVGDGTTDFGYEKWGFWGKGYGVFGDRKNKGEAAGYKYTVYGTSFGMDHQSTESLLVGVTAGYSKSIVDSSIPGNESNISSTHIGIYGSKNINYWHFDSIVTYSSLKYETERFINIVSEKLKGDSEGKGISGYVETRYDLGSFDRWLLQPLASFQFSYLTLDSYTETGGTSSLGYDDQDYKSYKGSLGLKLTKELFEPENDRIANIQLRGRFIHEFGDDNSSVDAHFASDPGVIFKVSDEDIARNSAVLGASFNAYVDLYTWVSLSYDAHLNSDNNMHILSAMFVYKW